jgi:hypothetical protein
MSDRVLGREAVDRATCAHDRRRFLRAGNGAFGGDHPTQEKPERGEKDYQRQQLCCPRCNGLPRPLK